MENALQPRNSTRIVLAISATIYAAYVPVALWVGHTYVPVEMPQGEMVEQIADIKHIEGFGYQARTPFLIR